MAKLEPKSTAQIPTKEELEMIRDSVLLPFMVTMVEQNAKELILSKNILKKLFVAAAQILTKRIYDDLITVKRELRTRNIKVFEDKREGVDLHYKYVCRGYEVKFDILRMEAKAEISNRLGRYVQRMESEFDK